MKAILPKIPRKAFARRDLLVLLATVALVVGVSLPLTSRRKRIVSGRVHCVSNLKQIGLALRMWSGDHGEQFPMAVSTNKGGSMEFIESGDIVRHFQVISNELNSPMVLACAEDKPRHWATNFTAFTKGNLSYFLGLDANETRPEMILAGDRTITTNGQMMSGLLQLSTGSPVSWAKGIHPTGGYVGLADGSAQQIRDIDLKAQVVRSAIFPARLAIP